MALLAAMLPLVLSLEGNCFFFCFCTFITDCTSHEPFQLHVLPWLISMKEVVSYRSGVPKPRLMTQTWVARVADDYAPLELTAIIPYLNIGSLPTSHTFWFLRRFFMSKAFSLMNGRKSSHFTFISFNCSLNFLHPFYWYILQHLTTFICLSGI